MPGLVVHQGAVVNCAHGGPAQPATPNPRVLVGGMPVCTLATPYIVAGCPASTRCASAQWTVGATRVRADGAALVVQGGQAVCAPTGTGLVVLTTQSRVVAT
jgi:hypothetical protein